MSNFLHRARHAFHRVVEAHKRVAEKSVHATERVANFQFRAAKYQFHVAEKVTKITASPHALGDYAKTSVRKNAAVLAKVNTAITGVASFVVSLFPVLGTAAAQVISGIGYGQGRYLGGVEGRQEGLHGRDANRVSRRRGNQALEAGEGGATIGLFTAIVAGTAAGGAAVGAEAGSQAAESAIPGGVSSAESVGTVAEQAAAPGVATITGDAAPALVEAAPAAALPATEGAAAAGGSILTVANVSAVTGLAGSLYKLVQGFFAKPPSGTSSVDSSGRTVSSPSSVGTAGSDAGGGDAGAFLDDLKKPATLAALGIGAGALTVAYLVKHKGKAA
jgi:hypothetical protein